MIVLPSSCEGAGGGARVFDRSPVVDASDVVYFDDGFMRGMVDRFAWSKVDRVSIKGASDRFREGFMVAHQGQGARFLVEFYSH